MGAKISPAREKKAGRSDTTKASDSGNGSLSLQNYFSGKYRDWGICCVIFCAALFVIITISNPALFINDEWITVNQVHQLDIGHQITINEGKYGVFQNGTPSPYFAFRKNVLMYSLALPLASLPVLKLFGLFADHFRLAVITLWAFLPFFASVIFCACYPARARIGNTRIPFITAAAGFLLLAANLLVYSPFTWSAPDAPIEVAAVVFTDHILFALTMVVTYLIARIIFEDRWKAIFAVLSAGACSAYLFWGANAKDHMATAFVFSLVLYWFIRYLKSRKILDAAAGFFCIGILAWIRPEVGFSAFLCFGIFVIADNLLRAYRGVLPFREGIAHCLTPLATLIGAIPFFINNIITSGNPFTPAFLLEEKARLGAEMVQVLAVNHTVTVSQSVTANPLAVGSDLIGTIGHFFFSVSPNPLPDIYGILFFPASGSMGMFFVVPIALVALLLLPLVLLNVRDKSVYAKRELLLFLLLASGVVILAYVHGLSGLNSSQGIGPDIRYLSPMYLPVILLSLLLLEDTILFAHPRTLVSRSCLLGIVLIPVLLLIMILFRPAWEPIAVLLPYSGANHYSIYPYFFVLLIMIEMIITLAVVAAYHLTGRKADRITDLLLPILIVTVLCWQVLMIFLISPEAKFNGYTFWIPGVDALCNRFLIVTTLP